MRAKILTAGHTIRVALGAILLVSLAACGDGPGPDGGVEQNSLVFACIRNTACGVKPYPTVSNCVGYYGFEGLEPVQDPIIQCSNRARGCAELRRCHGELADCDSSFTASCDGGKAVFCDLLDKRTFTYDCAAAKMSCAPDPTYGHVSSCTGAPAGYRSPIDRSLACAEGECERTGQYCTDGDFNRCAGEQLEACLGGGWVSFDCARLGLGPCGQTSTGAITWAHCTPPVP